MRSVKTSRVYKNGCKPAVTDLSHVRFIAGISPPWPQENEKTLRTRWANGDDVAIIADGMGITKNAVIGKARRMRLGQHKQAARYNPRLLR